MNHPRPTPCVEHFLQLTRTAAPSGGYRWQRSWSSALPAVQITAAEANERQILARLNGQGPAMLALNPDELQGLVSAGKHWLTTLTLSSLSPAVKLQIAISTTRALCDIHGLGIFVFNLRPGSLVLSADFQQAECVDFSAARFCSRDASGSNTFRPAFADPHFLAPEQSFEYLNQLDARTDLYSLGCILYWLFSGEMPFADLSRSEEIAYAHLSRQVKPAAPASEDDELAQGVWQIIGHLLAKEPQQRYQSSTGLLIDLEALQTSLNQGQPISLEGRSIADRLQVPQRLYGREAEVGQLLEAFERVRDGASEALLIGGYSGVGKSALVAEVRQPILHTGGLFVAGKFDQYQRHQPYSAIAGAFGHFVRYLLSLPAADMAQWRTRLNGVLHPNGRVLVELIPELAMLLGEQPELPPLGADEQQHRFNRTFLAFVHEICQSHKPLVLFIDDLQWADIASINLLRLLLTDTDSRHCLLLGAYRDNEVDERHPFMQMQVDVRQQRARLKLIHLPPLSQPVLTEIIADTLDQPTDEVALLASLVYQKTAGNPFFFKQFLQELYQGELLQFDHRQQHWRWSIRAIEAQGITDNVVELMARKVERLSSAAREMLPLAACIGSTFTLSVLQTLYVDREQALEQGLAAAFDAGLLLPLSSPEEQSTPHAVCFLHDRVQQAAYSRLAPEMRAQTHHRIGRQLMKSLTPAGIEERCFELVTHFNQALHLLAVDEVDDVLRLNLQAAAKAKAANAYTTAVSYLTHYFELCRRHEMADDESQIHAAIEQLECLYLAGDYQVAENLLTEVSSRCRLLEHQVRLNGILITQYTRYGQLERAISQGLTALSLLGWPLPDSPTMADVGGAIEQAQLALRLQPFARLVERESIEDPQVLFTLDILMAMQPSCYNSGSLLFPLTILGLLQLTLRHGNSGYSSYVYMMYGLLCTKVLKDYETAFEAARFSSIVSRRYPANPLLEGRLMMMHSNFILPWQSPLQQSMAVRETAYHHCLLQGDYYWGVHAYIFGFYAELLTSNNLDELLERSEQVVATCELIKQPAQSYLSTLQCNLLKILQGKLDNRDNLDHQPGYEQQAQAFYVETHYMCGRYDRLLGRLLQGYLFGNYQRALAVSLPPDLAADELDEGIFHEAVYTQLNLLCILALRQQSPEEVAAHQLAWFEQGWDKFQAWYQLNPHNFAPGYYLILAEQAVLEGDDIGALVAFEQAIHYAEQAGFVLYQAIACERCGHFRLGREQEMAKAHLRRALHCYQAWGAHAKAADLDALLAQLDGTRITAANYSIDWQAVLTASQEISKPLALNELSSRMLLRAATTTGARHVALYQRCEQRWQLTALCEEGVVISCFAQPDVVPASLLNYSLNSHQSLVLEDACREGTHSLDPYIAERGIRSAMSLPLLVREQLVGVLYLEHVDKVNLFSPQRVQVMELLASQFAISLQNATYYKQLSQQKEALEQAVSQRTLELNNQNAHLEAILEALPLPYVITLEDGQLLRGNERLLDCLELPADKLPSVEAAQFYVDPADREQMLSQVRARGGVVDFECQLKTYTGKTFWALFSATQMSFDRQKAIFAAISDISGRKAREEQLLLEASTDPLTGVLNRRGFEQLASAMRLSTPRQGICVTMLDIDHFKILNDTYGHAAGDVVLQEFTAQLQRHLRDHDILARIGGEEFALIITDLSPTKTLNVLQRIGRLTEALALEYQGESLRFTVSGGMTVWLPGEPLNTALHRADLCLYRAKEQGRNKILADLAPGEDD